jgi:hypothetical protein
VLATVVPGAFSLVHAPGINDHLAAQALFGFGFSVHLARGARAPACVSVALLPPFVEALGPARPRLRHLILNPTELPEAKTVLID